MSGNNNERQSAPTGTQTSELEQEANRPLGVASCSESFSECWELDENRIITRSDRYPEWIGQSPTQVIKGIRADVDELARTWRDLA